MDASDFGTLEALHSASEEPIEEDVRAANGLVGRLAGSSVAYLTWRRDRDAMTISRIFVPPDLRRLGIGRMLLAEAATIAADAGATELRVEQDCKLARYFERRGFVSAEGSLIKATR